MRTGPMLTRENMLELATTDAEQRRVLPTFNLPACATLPEVAAALGIPADTLAGLRDGSLVAITADDKARLDRAKQIDAVLSEELDRAHKRQEAEYAARHRYGPGTAAQKDATDG